MVILAAVDLEQSPHRPIVVGDELAAAYDERLVVVHVVSQDEYEAQRASTEDLPGEFSGNYSVDQASDRAANEVGSLVSDVLGRRDPARIEAVGRIGEAAQEIAALADQLDPRFVVVGGRNRSVAAQALFGSVSQSVMRQVDQPVVTTLEPAT